MANNQEYLREHELYVQNKEVLNDKYIKSKLKRVLGKIKALRMGGFSFKQNVEKPKIARRNRNRKSTMIISNQNLNEFLAHKIEVGSVLCRR